MRLTSIFALLSAAAAFSAKGVNITVNATVDSRLESVTLTAKLSSGSTQTMGPVSKNGSETWTAWSIGTAYTPTVTGEPTGYSARWKVIVDGEEKMSGGADSSITLQQSHAGCTLSFYAAPNAYTITLDQQSGSGGTASANATFDAPMPTITPPTRPGYEFCSYTNNLGVAYYNADGTSARTWDKTSGITLYAQWRATTQRVTFDMQLGSGGTTSTTATYDAAMPAITPPTRPGYEFCSYTTAPNGGGTQYYNADGTSAHTWDIASDTTLYANWTVITSTVTLNPQGGSGGSTSVTATYASPMPPITLPSRTGYKFHAYFSEPEGVGTRYYNAKGASARKWDQTSNTTLYAHWIEIPAPPPPPDDPTPPPPDDPEPPSTYMVTLDPQGGSGGTESVTATNGVAMPAIIPPSLDGYEFCSYTNSTGVAYYNADGTSAHEWDIASDTTLYASWKLVRVPGNLAVAVDAPELDFETFGTVGPQGRWDEERTNFNWFVQTDFVHESESAVQSHALPVSSSDYQVYCSWLTTTVEGKGVLSFWWKCAAKPRQAYESETGYKTYGDVFRFGVCDENPFVPSETLEGLTDWVHCAYTNNTDGKVTLAWAFTYADYAGRVTSNGGGTGWVDRVEWIPDEPPQDPDDTQLVCTVKFDAQGGTATETERAVTNGCAVGTLPTATRAGYSGGDWYTASEGGSKVSASTVITNDVTFYARWSAETFTVYFYWNHFAEDTRGGNNQWTYGSDLSSTLSPASRERDGYDFLGYFTEREGGTQYVYANGTSATWNIPSNTTLYAHWKPIQYCISFDANAVGVVNTMDTMDCTYDVPTNLTSCAFERTGYGFAGWTNSVGTTFADGAVVSNLTKVSGMEVLLYAKWTAKTYTVSFDDGSGAASSSSITYGDSIEPPMHEGYVFGGYFTEPNGGGTKCYNADGSMESVDEATISDATLYAYWMANSYTLSFNSAGGSSVDPITLPCGTTITAPVVPTKEGYSFAGWNPALPTTMPAENKTVTAQWQINQYTLTFNTDGGSEIASIKQNYNTTITAPANPTKTGYTFAGWDSTIPTKMPAENKTVTAQWTPIQYTISFAANAADATGDMDPMDCTYDVPTNLTSCAFTRTGYGFAGWTNSAGTAFADGALVSNLTATANGNVTLYAQWAETGYTVTLDAGNGVGFMTNSIGEEVSVITDFAVVIGDAWNLPTAVTNINPDLVFAGWKYVKEGETNALPDKVPASSEGVTNLVATWGDALAVALDAPGLVFRTFDTVANDMVPFNSESFDHTWSVQVGCGDDGLDAVRSGELPLNPNDWKTHVSWLTTTVEGKGVLSFWWKCAAKPLDAGCGDMLRFGKYGIDAFTPLAELTEVSNPEWQHVTYTNNVEGSVTFAWAFVYIDGMKNNGGGTGWVDRVEWKQLP